MSKRIQISNPGKNRKPSDFWSKFLQINPQFYEPSKRLDRLKANQFNNGKREKPYITLERTIDQNPFIEPSKDEKYLIHWFRNDLRIHDNLSLLNTIEMAKKLGKKVITIYVFNEFDLRRHLDSAFKINFIQRTLDVLRNDLIELNIPLKIIYTDQKDFSSYFIKLITEEFQAKTISFNVRFEWDEINDDISIIKSDQLNVSVVHEQCIIEPFKLTTGKGTVYSKFTPWWKNWAGKTLEMFKNGELKCLDAPKPFENWDYEEFLKEDTRNLDKEFTLDSLLEKQYKGIIENSDLTVHKETFKAGEREAYKIFNNYIESGDVLKYTTDKDPPLKSGSSHLSHQLAQGTISIRYIFGKLIEMNNNKTIGGNINIETFIKELAWREFFRHLVSNWPYSMMYVPTNLASLDLISENSEEKFKKWCYGETGFPIVDACMKQLLRTGYMNNRCRMICSSFLAKDLNVDYRAGELWFYHHLVDGDFISNNQGWQWTTSTGIDSQPWFRIFNVFLQSEKFDRDCKFIKKWIPELKSFTNKQIHFADGLKGYHKPCIDRDGERETTLERYRQVMSNK